MKIFNYLNGIFYVLYGLFGALMPKSMASLMGWDPSLLGLHQIRSIWLAVAAIGLLLCHYSRQSTDQKPITLAIIFVTLTFMCGRFLGLLLDGTGPIQTYQEIGLEVVVVLLGTFLIKRGKA